MQTVTLQANVLLFIVFIVELVSCLESNLPIPRSNTYCMSRCNSLNVLPVELVGAVDGCLVPVGPVHIVFEGGDRERVAEHVSRVQDHATRRPIVVAR